MAEKIPESQLSEIEAITLGHYENNASSFWRGTKDHDVTQNYEKFLCQFPEERALDILDFGCGPGRDLRYFQSLGHRPVGLDGSEAFCDMAQVNSGCPVLHQQFLSLDLPNETFDGVFANASLFHIPGQELPRVLRELHSTLRPNGILFSSNITIDPSVYHALSSHGWPLSVGGVPQVKALDLKELGIIN